MSLLNRQDATPCGKGWKGTKPGCERASGESSETVKDFDQNAKPKNSRSSLPKNHSLTSDPRITVDTIDKLFDGLDTPGASDRINVMREILNNQGIQAVFNDSVSKGKNDRALFDQIEHPLVTGARKKAIEKLTKKANDIQSENPELAETYRKKIFGSERQVIGWTISNQKGGSGYTAPTMRHVVITTNSTGRGEFKTNSNLMSNTVKNVIARAGRSVTRQWAMNKEAKDLKEDDTAAAITYLHEVGHQVQYAAESTGKLKTPAAEGKFYKSLTDYSTATHGEWFAEHFTAWTLDADTYRKFDPDGADYIEKAVKLAQKAKRRNIDY